MKPSELSRGPEFGTFTDDSVLAALREIRRVRTSWKMQPRVLVRRQMPESKKTVAQWEDDSATSMSHATYQSWVADRMYYAVSLLSDSIEVDPDLRSGVPVLRGTRVPVSQIFAEVADGSSIVEIADDLEIDVTTIRGFVEGFSVFLDRSFMP